MSTVNKKPCEKCGREYRTTDMSRHLRTCRGPKKTTCDHCARTFKHPSTLARHLRTCRVKRAHDKRVQEEALQSQLAAVRAENKKLRRKQDRKDARLERKDQELDALRKKLC